MIETALIDALRLKGETLASIWRDFIRKSPQLKHYNEVDDERLIAMNADFYPVLARFLDRGADRAAMGSFFVKSGKDRMRAGFPVSEVLFALHLTQKVVVEYLLEESIVDSSMQLYRVVEMLTRISEYFLLGSFYLTKGFLEETYVTLNIKESVSEELLKRYFRDDFFFK